MAATMHVTFDCPSCGNKLSLPLQLATPERNEGQLIVEMHSTPAAEAVIADHVEQMHARGGALA